MKTIIPVHFSFDNLIFFYFYRTQFFITFITLIFFFTFFHFYFALRSFSHMCIVFYYSDFIHATNVCLHCKYIALNYYKQTKTLLIYRLFFVHFIFGWLNKIGEKRPELFYCWLFLPDVSVLCAFYRYLFNWLRTFLCVCFCKTEQQVRSLEWMVSIH